MDYDELAKVIKGMTKVQRKTEVVVFEEGTRRYIWPAGLESEPKDPNRPFLVGVAAEGDTDKEFFDPATAKGTTNKEVDGIQANPTELDSAVGTKPDRVRAARPNALEAPKKGGRKGKKK